VRITATAIPGVAVLELELREDERGFFARTFCREEFLAAGLEPLVEQCNLSFNHRAGTLRGMHYQVHPAPEAKLVRCTRGAIVDQVVDMREGSPTYLRHVAVELTADNQAAVKVRVQEPYAPLREGTNATIRLTSLSSRPSPTAGVPSGWSPSCMATSAVRW